jgi:PKD-like domain
VATVNVVVTPTCISPTITSISSNSPVCQGSNVNLMASATAGTYAWSGPNGFVSTQQNPVLTAVTSGGTYTLVVANGSSSCAATATLSVVVNPNPTIAATGATVCVGSLAQITALSNANSYAWSGPNGFTSTQQTASIPNAAQTASGAYTVRVTSTANCAATTVVNVLVNVCEDPVCISGKREVLDNRLCGNSTSYGLFLGELLSNSGVSPQYFSISQPGELIEYCDGTAMMKFRACAVGGAASDCIEMRVNLTSRTNVAPSGSPKGSHCPNFVLNTADWYYYGGTMSGTMTGLGGAYSGLQANISQFGPAYQQGSGANLNEPGYGASTWFTINVTNGGTNNWRVAPDNDHGDINVNLTPITPLPVTATSNSPVCVGGTINLTASYPQSNASGSCNLTYAWTGPNGYTSTMQNPTITNTTTDNTGIYTVTVLVNGSCTATGTVSVVVNPDPTITATGSIVCAGNTITLGANGGATYQWSGPAGFSSTNQNPTIPNATTTNAGIYTVTATSTAGCVGSATTQVTVNPSLTASATGATVCAGNSLTLNASGGRTYAWTGPNGFTSNQQNPSISGVTQNNAGTYLVVVSSGDCTATASANVSVVAQPNAGATISSPVCEGTNVILAASGGTTYAWSGPNGFVSTQQNPAINTVSLGSNGTYTVIVSAGNNCSATATAVLIVNPNPTAMATGATVCVGQNIQLTAQGGTTYLWSGAGGFVSTAQNPVIVNANTSNAGVYTVRVTNAAGCTSMAMASVTVNPAPTVSASSNSPVIEGAAINLTVSSNAISFAWTGPNGFTSNIQNPSIASASQANAGVYTLTVTSASGCTATTTVPVIVTSSCVIPTNMIATSNTPVCAGQVISLGIAASGSYSWTGPNGFSSTMQNPIIPNATNSNTGVYTIVVSAGTNCAATATVAVVVSPAPTASATGATACVGGAINLTVNSNGTNFNWTGPNGYTSGIQNPTIASASLANAGTYSVLVSNASGCTTSATANVTVNPNPTAVVTGATTVCAGGSTTLTASGGSAYLWTPGGQTTPSITVTQAGTYVVEVTNANGCRDVRAVEVRDASLSLTAPPVAVCEGNTAALSAGPQTGTYRWTGPNGFTSTVQFPSIVNASASNAGSYVVNYTSTGGCTASAIVNLTVNPRPTASISGSDDVCTGGAITLTASGGVSFLWTPGNLSTQSINVTQPGTYQVTVTDAAGCQNTASKTVGSRSFVISAPNKVVCEGGTVTLNASGGSNYIWTGPNGFTSGQQNPVINNVTTASAGVYTVNVTSIEGCVASAVATLTVNPAPTSTRAVSFCEGGNATLTASGGTSYVWSTGQTTSSISVNQGGQFTVTITDLNGCKSIGVFNVTRNPRPTATITGNNNLCGGANTTLTASGGTTYVWSPGGQTSPSITVNTAGTYSVEVTDANGCKATAQTTVTTSGLTVSANGGVACAGGSVNLSSTGGISYQWTGPNSFTSTQQNPTLSGLQQSNTGLYVVTITGSGGCTATATANVLVNLAPTASVTSNSPVCVGNQLILGVTGGANYLWTGPNGFSSAQQNPAVSGVTAANAGTYTVTAQSSAGCSAVATINVTIQPRPAFSTDIDLATCTNGVSNTDGKIYLLGTNPGDRFAIVQGTVIVGNPTLESIPADGIIRRNIPNPATPAGQPYTIRVVNAAGCSTDVTINFLYNICPIDDPCTNDICVPFTIQKRRN